jgi:signal transduction histidine kinase
MSEENTTSFYQNILDNIDDLIITINEDDKIIKINKSAEKMLLEINKNKTSEHPLVYIGDCLFDYLNFDDNKYKHKYKIVEDVVFKTKTYIIKASSVSISDVNLRDVSEDIDHSNLIEKECFLFNVSHEIRTPLNGISE